MKSAYELAMERLEKVTPTAALSSEQKEQIAEIESVHKSRIAEKELLLHGEIASARAKGQVEEVEMLEQQLARELRRLREDLEEKKAKIRGE